MVAMYFVIWKEKITTLKFHMNNYTYFEISASPFLAPHVKDSKINERWGAFISGNKVSIYVFKIPICF